MAKPFRKLEVILNGTIYILDRTASVKMLEQLDAADAVLGETANKMREDLRAALATESEEPAAANPFEGDEDSIAVSAIGASGGEAIPKTETLKSVAKENAEACGDCRIPKCRFCEKPGKRKGGRKDGAGRTVEHYYVCTTDDCLAQRTGIPQPLSLFSGTK